MKNARIAMMVLGLSMAMSSNVFATEITDTSEKQAISSSVDEIVKVLEEQGVGAAEFNANNVTNQPQEDVITEAPMLDASTQIEEVPSLETSATDIFLGATQVTYGEVVEGELSDKTSIQNYKFTTPKDGIIVIGFESYIEQYDLILKDKDGKVLFSDVFHEWDSELQSGGDIYVFCLKKGDYKVEVSRSQGSNASGNFRFQSEFADTEINHKEPNDTFETAANIKLNTLVNGQISLNSEQDFYKFTVGADGKVSIPIVGILENYTFNIFDNNKKLIFQDKLNTIDATGDAGKEYKLNLKKGSYYIQIESSKTLNYISQGFYGFKVVLQRGWVADSGYWFYFKTDGNLAKGWLKDAGKWYYLDPKSGAMYTGWVYVGGKYYCLNTNGFMKTGWFKEKNNWYYLKAGGDMALGWVKVGKSWYYMGSNGIMKTGWISSRGLIYYCNPNGTMVTKWKKIGSYWYHFNNSGACQGDGWLKDAGKWYYLDEQGRMATNRWVGNSYVNGSGAWVKSR